MQRLDPLKLPLQGQILIEASAGTGKTYTIGLLFLRLLLERELAVDEILVVTFTRAATEELRGRIRLRIREALDELEAPGQGDDSLRELIGTVADPGRAVILLEDALTRMDEAAIFTIHGFCQRMLQEHAFESGAPFEMEFLENETRLRNRIMEDFWRQRFSTATVEEAAWARSLWKSPDALLGSLGGHLSHPNVRCIPVVDNNDIETRTGELQPLFQAVRAMWQENQKEVINLLKESGRLSRNKKSGYHPARIEQAAGEITTLLQSDHLPLLSGDAVDLLTTGKIHQSLLKNNKPIPEHPFFDLFEQFLDAHRRLTEAKRIKLLLDARAFLLGELKRRKEKQGLLFFDDLLSRLDAGLHGPDGPRLAKAIHRRFPVILVDEFQDTDPLQYRIFRRVHRAGQGGKQPAGLFLIGDPKQAIYSFRGADIFTYLRARRETPRESCFTMATNYRSTTAMVEKVNLLFARKNPFLLSGQKMDFHPVQSAGIADQAPLVLDGAPLAPLHCLYLANTTKKALSKDKSTELASSCCANQISFLLKAGSDGRALIGDRPLEAGDIAVLVRTHREGDTIRADLSRLGITSVSFSPASVFSGPEAQQMLLVLRILCNPTNGGLIRTLLAGPLFGLDGTEIYRLHGDDQAWEELLANILSLRSRWHERGFLPMFQELLVRGNTVGRLLAEPGGERAMTNLLHLAELLQGAERAHHRGEGLLRWLSEQIREQDAQADAMQLRLESDENLVKIVTIHKAKGLEYPIVFLPFLWSARASNPKEPLAFHDPDNPDTLCIDLGTEAGEAFEQAERERLAGDLRLLYVAITRARHSCFFCWGRINKMQESALFYLLHKTMPEDDEHMRADLARLDGKDIPVRFLDPAQKQGGFFAGKTENSRPPEARVFRGCIDRSWQITSYSRLSGSTESRSERPDYDQDAEPLVLLDGHDPFTFPRGADAGTCLHAILEEIDFTDRATFGPVVREQLEAAGFEPHWEPVVEQWLGRIVACEILPGFSLAALSPGDRVNEMAFYFPLDRVDLKTFNRTLTDFSFAPLPEEQIVLNGLMTGFIDLVFRRNGRYYVADYKSNHLGNRPRDYCQQQIDEAMSAHRYDLQYLIYTLALHRFLRSRTAGYSYGQQMGGVLYLFLRGMHPDYPPGTGLFTKLPPAELIDRLDRCCSGDRL